jgi:hypothetical protein
MPRDPVVGGRSTISLSGSGTTDRTCAKNSAPRSVGEPGAPKIQVFFKRETIQFSPYENHESLALLSQALSCFSASSLAMP